MKSTRFETAVLENVTLKTGQWSPQEHPDTAFKYIDINSINRMTKTIEGVKRLLGSQAPSRARLIVHEDDVIVSTVRPNLNAVALITKDLDKATASTGFCILRPDDRKLDSRYLYYFVRHRVFISRLVERATGASYPAVTDKIILGSQIPLPPLPVQKKIAAILEKADHALRKRGEVNKLTDQFLESAFFEILGDPASNPKKWDMGSISELVMKEKHSLMRGPFGGTIKKEIFVPDGYKVYEQKNAIQNDFNLGSYYINEEKYKELISFAIAPNDLIISCSGTIGKVAIVPNDARPGIINQALLKVRFDNHKALPLFMQFMFKSSYLQNKLFQNTPGSAIKNVVSLRTIRDTKIPLPPLSVQKEFTSFVEKVRDLCEKQRQSEQELETLFLSLMQKTFNGELYGASTL